MPHKDLEKRKAYLKEYQRQRKEANPEKFAQDARDRANKYAAKNRPQMREKFKEWYYEKNGKERQRITHGYKPLEEHLQNESEKKAKHAAYMREWIKSDAGKRHQTAVSIKRRCGLTIEEFDKTYDAQNGQCRICKKECPRYGEGRLVVDHCHVGGHFRALLCFNCNSGLGMFGESVEVMEAAIVFLKEHI